MAGSPRSQRLIAWNPSGNANSPSWVCPSGYTTLVKSALAYNAGAAATLLTCIATFQQENLSIYVFQQSVAPNQFWEWNGWMVLHPGDSIFLSVGAGPWTTGLFGAVLAGPPHFGPAPLEQVETLPSLPPMPPGWPPSG